MASSESELNFMSGFESSGDTTDIQEGTQDDLNCTEFEKDEFFASISIIRSVAGVSSGVCSLLVITVIVCFRKYKFFTQRLILNLAVASLIHSLSFPLSRVNYYTSRPLFDPYCYFGGFFHLYSSWIEVLALSCFLFNAFLNEVLDKWPQRIEYFYFAFTYTAPIFWTWIPFLDKTFGNGDAWCEIRSINEDCSRHVFGASLRFILWYIPLALLLTVLFVLSLVSVYKIKKKDTLYHASRSHQKRVEMKLKEEVKPLVWYPIVYLLLNTFSFVNSVDVVLNPLNSNIYLWYLHVFTSPLRGAFLVVAYALDPETRRRLSLKKFRARAIALGKTFRSRSKRSNYVKSYRFMERSRGESLRGQHRIESVSSPQFTSVNYEYHVDGNIIRTVV